MKYDLVDGFREYLKKSLQPSTARTYANRMELLLADQSLLSNQIDIENIINNLSTIKYENYFSQSKNALFYFLKYKNISLPNEKLEEIEKLKYNTSKKYRKQKLIDFPKINKKIKYLRNNKMKLSFETMLNTGLRVSELSQIKKKDCTINNDSIIFLFEGKGGDMENITLYKKDNKKLFNVLKSHIEKKAVNDKLFYSAPYLQKQAEKLDFSCHDLRRIFAKQEYQKTKSKIEVMKKLRHENIETIEIYLNSKVKF
ncbi:site-specific integrase [[Clostridium] symbiosum]|uniref:site-specific integrase n=1 Tax=Clostridium symbiosum TaxID=1512 RepID=UPI001D077C35|nr:site-specific integrase [[Clostridium] symbiosum]MCB6608450.1 site-specific integrase [[Clostridium] symbiosum]MCB6930664.1 site-specific integrase [[Clostridium] symbiosum]